MAQQKRWQEPEALVLLRGWAREGLSEDALAQRMGISVATLHSWKKKYPAIREALDTTLDYQVEDALLRKALGYENRERRVELSAKGERKEVETVKQVGPDMSAITLWLKKRRPDRWGDNTDGGPKPENNLHQLLDGTEEGVDFDNAIPELQSQTEVGDDLVEAGALPES